MEDRDSLIDKIKHLKHRNHVLDTKLGLTSCILFLSIWLNIVLAVLVWLPF